MPFRRGCLPAAALAAAMAPAAAVAQPGCTAGDGRIALPITGEVSAGHIFSQTFGPGWTFQLYPQPHGWFIAVKDPLGIDLSAITPPWTGINARQLDGWHFRNAANTAANDGSVNAPQELRLFRFHPALSGTAGFRPPDLVLLPEPDPAEGRGTLRILDYGLADLDPGEQARMVWLSFEACLTWPADLGGTEAPPPRPLLPEEVEQIRACGLPPGYDPAPFASAGWVAGDFDGDGAHDLAVPVVRLADGGGAIAVCRAGTWLDILEWEDR